MPTVQVLIPPPSARAPRELIPGETHKSRWDSLLAAPPSWDVATVVTRSMLHRVHDELRHGPNDVTPAMIDLICGLWSLKSSSPPEVWDHVIEQCIASPVCKLIHQDPFALRSFQQPRGYPGDAVLIDYLYTRNCRLGEADDVSPLGQRIFSFIRDIPAGRAVRQRRDMMAKRIDDVCRTRRNPSILSVACGHLREAELSAAVTAREFGSFIALDQDQMSLRVVEQETGRLGVSTVCNSIKALFRGELADRKFDFIYSTGLYDYLDDRIGTKLTHRMFDMLNPGGQLLVANFLPDVISSAYMEAFMNWKLIYRTSDQMAELCSTIPADSIAKGRMFVEENETIAFLEISKQ